VDSSRESRRHRSTPVVDEIDFNREPTLPICLTEESN
jgi:hypothetical protein